LGGPQALELPAGTQVYLGSSWPHLPQGDTRDLVDQQLASEFLWSLAPIRRIFLLFASLSRPRGPKKVAWCRAPNNETTTRRKVYSPNGIQDLPASPLRVEVVNATHTADFKWP
jgi:hypothetical protein